MTFVGHAYTGAVAALLLSRAIGVDAPVAAPVIGGLLGSAPDTVDWVGSKLKLWPCWWMYVIMHHQRVVVFIECLLIFPGLHLLFDKFLHYPVIPRAGMSADYDMELFTLFGKSIKRRDIHWLTGELMMASLTTNALIWL